jgi:flagellar basal-body rod protein FlgC
MNALGIAASGLTAATTRLSVVAQNVANIDSTEPAADGSGAVPYTPYQVMQTPLASGGVRAEVRRAPSYQPAAPAFPLADIFAADPGVDLVTQAVEQASAMTAFRANLAVIRAAEEMAQAAIDTTA